MSEFSLDSSKYRTGQIIVPRNPNDRVSMYGFALAYEIYACSCVSYCNTCAAEPPNFMVRKYAANSGRDMNFTIWCCNCIGQSFTVS
jgi:hypothetical protein